MLFNTSAFVLGFLPVVLGVFAIASAWKQGAATLWLAGASLFFYAMWNPAFVTPLLGSIACNFTANLLLLAYFKHANFFISNLDAVGAHFDALNVVLPIGISFYTFTRIAFLVDTHRGLVDERSWLHYLLFVTWFPHLVAGPVLHHAQMMPQFARAQT